MRLRDTFLSLVKGAIVGISSLIPGISSGAILISLGIYNDVISGIGNFFKKNNKKLFIVVIPMFFGLIAGVFGGQKVVSYFFDNYLMQTIFLFVGLIAGGYKLVIENINSYKRDGFFKNVVLFLLVFIMVILIQILVVENINLSSFLTKDSLLFGFISGFFLLIPGLSLTANDFINNNNILLNESFLFIFLFVVGFSLSILIFCYILNKILSKNSKCVMVIVSSMLTASIVIAILQIDKFTFGFVNIFTTILAFLWGYILAKNLKNE